ncbi:MAG: hypothetical protein ACRC2T_02590 [Thermoguttaceae bacterium]
MKMFSNGEINGKQPPTYAGGSPNRSKKWIFDKKIEKIIFVSKKCRAAKSSIEISNY